MPFTICPFRRLPVQCVVTYNSGLFQCQDTAWNLSCTGWRLSSDLPMRPGETLSLTVTLPNEQRIQVPEAVCGDCLQNLDVKYLLRHHLLLSPIFLFQLT